MSLNEEQRHLDKQHCAKGQHGIERQHNTEGQHRAEQQHCPEQRSCAEQQHGTEQHNRAPDPSCWGTSADGSNPPFETRELWSAFYRPERAVAYILTEHQRLISTILLGRDLGVLVALLVFTSLIYALPMGLILDGGPFWRIAVLYTGSLLICFPALCIFSAYLGSRLSLLRNLALALVLTSVASLFSLAFAPILWFFMFTMSSSSAAITPDEIAVLLLTISLLMGLIHQQKCHGQARALSMHSISLSNLQDRCPTPYRSTPARPAELIVVAPCSSLLLYVWQILLLFVTFRMGLFLGLS